MGLKKSCFLRVTLLNKVYESDWLTGCLAKGDLRPSKENGGRNPSSCLLTGMLEGMMDEEEIYTFSFAC